jgi:alanine transaminase
MKLITSRSFSVASKKILTQSNISPNLIKAEYAVRGYIPTLAGEIRSKIKVDPSAYSFSEIVQLNIGNPLIFNTKPMWTFRQLIGNYLQGENIGQFENLVSQSTSFEYLSSRLNEGKKSLLFQDYQRLANQMSEMMPSRQRTIRGGYEETKNAVASMMYKRDGVPAESSKIFLSNGASSAIRLFFDFIIDNPNTGILIPIPQYPLYSALITLFNGQGVPYYLDEADNWNITIQEVEKAYESSLLRGIKPKAIVLINPGNPTGNVFKRKSMEQIIAFAHSRNLILLADEVYQENIYCNEPWVSFKQVLAESPSNIANELELVSFHSLSKGILSECGLRGGYVEMINLDPSFFSEFEKIYASTWPNAIGQAMMTLKCKFLSGELKNDLSPETYNLLINEYQEAYDSLKFRAKAATLKLNEAKNVVCNPIDGAMYAFPQIKLPDKFIKAAQTVNLKPDVFYCKTLLEKTGICMVPGSGFGQKEGTYHFRTTILPAPDAYFTQVFEKFRRANDDLMNEYS